MRKKQKIEAEKRAKYFLILTTARIVAEITIILGFFIVIYFLLRTYIA